MSLDNMKKRLEFAGGNSDGRNVQGKYLSFKSALIDSYQAEDITFKGDQWRCLINPDKLKEDYDLKEISIDFKAHMKDGDVFYWNRTESYWIVYLQHLEEEAYFRASIRKCNYNIEINNNRYWIYVRGPVETALIWRQKHQIEMNDLNYSLLMYITKNEETLEYFKRFQVIKFDGHNWRVAATDKYSQKGIIEVYLEEYFDNEMEDNMRPPQVVDFNKEQPYIDGPQIIRPWDIGIKYEIKNLEGGEFFTNSKKIEIKQFENICLVNVVTGKATKAQLVYRVEGQDDIILNLTIQSL